MIGEIMYELNHSGEAPPQCCVCKQPAEHRCECREHMCHEHSFECDLCHQRFCEAHITKMEDVFVCAADMPEFLKEAAAVLDAERVLEEVMA